MKAFLPLVVILGPALAAAQQAPAQDLRTLDIEDLMKVEVTTASKSGQALADVPAAIYVINSEDIRRSGAMNVPEALRLAPGVDVSQIDANKWMVSIRGFNSRFADKLLVLVDGKTAYTPLFSGVYWDTLDLPLSTVDRIEVIRGPGGSLWGANAVNGVINIITKKASQTQGSLLNLELGSDQKLKSTYRYGGQFSRDSWYRVYTKVAERGPLSQFPDAPEPDGWKSTQAGFRIDGGKDTGDKYMIKGDWQGEHLGQEAMEPILTPPYSQTSDLRFPASQWSAVAKWERNAKNGASESLQASFDHTDRRAPEVFEKRDTFDLDYQKRLAPLGLHSLTIGAGIRRTSDSTSGDGSQDVYTPPSFTANIFSAFIHDTLSLKPHWKLLLGSKFEHNPFTGLEVQPNAQILYTPTPQRTYWASISRAVVTPSRAERGAHIDTQSIPGPMPIMVAVLGNPAFKSGDVLAFETGARFSLGESTFLDVAAFYNRYQRLRTFEPGQPFLLNGQLTAPLYFGNKLSGDTEGVEIALKMKPRPWWSLSASYSLFSEKLRLASDSLDQGGYSSDGRGGAANQKFQIHSYMDLGSHFEFDNDLYYTSALINGNVPAYWKLDSRLGWSPSTALEFSVGVRNALSARHLEAGESTFETIGRVPRSIYFRVTWHF